MVARNRGTEPLPIPRPRPRTTGDASWSFPGSRNSHWPSLAPARDSPGCSVAHDWHARARCDLAPSTDRPPGAVRPQALATRSTGRHRPADPPSMAARTALPDELLLGSFTVARARRLSVSRGRLRNPELEAPTRGVRRAATADPEPADHARAFASVLPDDVAFSHVTAARLHALPTPKPWPGADEPLDVMRARHRPPSGARGVARTAVSSPARSRPSTACGSSGRSGDQHQRAQPDQRASRRVVRTARGGAAGSDHHAGRDRAVVVRRPTAAPGPAARAMTDPRGTNPAKVTVSARSTAIGRTVSQSSVVPGASPPAPGDSTAARTRRHRAGASASWHGGGPVGAPADDHAERRQDASDGLPVAGLSGPFARPGQVARSSRVTVDLGEGTAGRATGARGVMRALSPVAASRASPPSTPSCWSTSWWPSTRVPGSPDRWTSGSSPIR